MSRKIQAHLALFLVAVIYGGNYIVAKEVMDPGYLQPLAFIVLRVAIGFILFFTFASTFIREAIEWKDFPRILTCAIFGVAANQLFFFSGLKLTTPINASLIMTTTPILVLIASALIIGEKITGRKIIGIICGGCGAILLIAYGKNISFEQSHLLGDFFVLMNAISYGIFLVIAKSLMRKYHPVTIMKWLFGIGFWMVLPFGYRQLAIVEWGSFPTNIWWAIAYVLIGATFLVYLFNAFALKIVNPSVVSFYIYLQPLFAALFAILLAKDELTLIKVVAAILIFLGVHLVSGGKSKNQLSEATETS